MPFTRFYADCIGSGTLIPWEDMLWYYRKFTWRILIGLLEYIMLLTIFI
jgi:hypothetical protein